MGFNVSTSIRYQIENKENLQTTARTILNNSGASAEQTSKIIEQTFFNNNQSNYVTPQYTIMQASTQITLNNSLKETLQYIKTHSKRKNIKQYVLGELWSIIETNNESSDENPSRGELYDFQIDKNVKNIFAA